MGYLPRLVTAPTETPVSLAEVKARLGVTGTADDVVLTAGIASATALLDGPDGRLGRCLVQQTWEQGYDAFGDRVPLSLPALSMVQVTYLDAAAGAVQTLSTSVYQLKNDARGSYLALKRGQSWPSTSDEPEAVTVRYVAGYGAASAVPAPLKEAVMLIVRDLYRAPAAAGLKKEVVEGVGSQEWEPTMVGALDWDRVNGLIGPYRRRWL